MWITTVETAGSLPRQIFDASHTELFDFLEKKGSKETRNEEEKINSPGFILARYIDNTQSKDARFIASDSTTSIFCYDIDSMGWPEIQTLAEKVQNMECLFYSTFKHSPEKPRFRFIIALDKEVSSKPNIYIPTYLKAARDLGIMPDMATRDPGRLFFAPQHKPDVEPVMLRFRGSLYPVEIVEQEASAFKPPAPSQAIRQDRHTLSNLIKKWSSSKPEVAGILRAILDGEGYAEEGERHAAGLRVTMALANALGDVDGGWFADIYLKKIWEKWNVDFASSRADWVASTESANRKTAEWKEKRRKERISIEADNAPPLNGVELLRAQEKKGVLIVSHRNSFYVYDPKKDLYEGPYVKQELAVACRQYLSSIPGFSLFRDNLQIKSATEFLLDYGTAVKDVSFCAYSPKEAFCKESCTLFSKAYHWNAFKPVYHPIAMDLLEAVSKEKIDDVLTYLSQFRNLRQCLPALALIGPGKVWKTQIPTILSRFWNDKEHGTPAKASYVMRDFSEPLLKNPVIFADEYIPKKRGESTAERYREMITAKSHLVNTKGVAPVNLVTAVRHMCSANAVEKIFSNEVDRSCVEATMERFLILEIDKKDMEAFEARWKGTKEMDSLREGTALLEHVMWLEENVKAESRGRLFLDVTTEQATLMKARFENDLLYICIVMALETVDLAERAPTKEAAFVMDDEGKIRLRPEKIFEQWSTSDTTARLEVRSPSTQKIGIYLTKAGFKKIDGERASKAPFKGWEVDVKTLEAFLEEADLTPLKALRARLVALKNKNI